MMADMPEVLFEADSCSHQKRRRKECFLRDWTQLSLQTAPVLFDESLRKGKASKPRNKKLERSH